MAKSTRKSGSHRTIGAVFAGLCLLAAVVAVLLQGADVALLNPKGHIASEQYKLLMTVTVLLLQIGIPTLIVFYFVAWKYRESNHKATYAPEARSGTWFSIYLWIIPSVTAVLIALVLWPATHRLEPKKAISTTRDPLVVQVIAMRWKWLFIYPEQNIATVNYVQVPVNTPLQFELSADEAPMSSFWIPHLGGQLYAMTGHVNRLNLIGDEIGQYRGISAEINGPGFAGMRFWTHVTSTSDFEQWVQSVQETYDPLTAEEYQNLLKPSENNQQAFYGSTEGDLYGTMLMKYEGSHGGHHTESE